MRFFSSRIELNNTIKSLESEIEKLKFETSNKLEQIIELNNKISTLSQKNAEYEKKYINTNLECEFCYTTLQKEFVFCPKCGKKIEVKYNTTKVINTNCFVTEFDSDGCVITRYNGFDEKCIIIPSQISGRKVIGIADRTFSNCRNIEEVLFENGCEYIGNKAFYQCRHLKKIRLPKTLKEIGESAFSGTSLEEIFLPPNIRTLGSYAFSYCKNLKVVVLSENLSVIPSFAFLDSGLEKIDIPNSIKVVGEEAFSNTLLKDIDLPRDLQIIKRSAFFTPTIQKITIHSNVTRIEEFACHPYTTIHCAAGSEAQKYARENVLQMVQIDSVPNPLEEEKMVSSIRIEYGDSIWNSEHGIPQSYFPAWIKRIIGGYEISHWHWNFLGERIVYFTKPYTLSEAKEIKKKIKNHSQNMIIDIEFKMFGE